MSASTECLEIKTETSEKSKSLGWRHLPWPTLIIIGIFVFAGIFAPWVAPHEPEKINLALRLEPPSAEYLLGTDSLGRDVLSRLIYGARVTLVVVLSALALGTAIGVALGLIAGYSRGSADAIISRTIDALLSFPSIFFGLLFAVSLGAGLSSVVLAIVFIIWARFARVIRAEVVGLRDLDFVAQAKIIGCSPARIIIVHLLPNVITTSMVLISIDIGYVITLEASLSYLGAGIPPPTPSWGGMIAEGQAYLSRAWWIALVPGFAIFLTVMAFNWLGDWMRIRLDPKLRDLE